MYMSLEKNSKVVNGFKNTRGEYIEVHSLA